MKKTFKGFTLVECLVAMAILAIASTLMASIYANVASRNNFNHFNNTSLSNQMKYIEQYENAETVKIANTYSGTNPPHPTETNSGTTAYVKITKYKSDGISLESDSYSYPVDVYIMYSRDTKNVGSSGKDENGNAATFSGVYAEKDNNLRYKYILGHTP